MPEPYNPTNPLFRVRMWKNLLQKLGTTTLAVVVFGVVVPVAVLICTSIYAAYERRALGMSVAGVIKESVLSVPTIISACITAFVWLCLLAWASLLTIRNDTQCLADLITEKDKYIQELGDIMTKTADENAATTNENARNIDKIVDLQRQLAITKEQLTLERNQAGQPDVTLVWDWTEDQRQTRSLMGFGDKNILVHNRSAQFVYNVQIEPIKLSQEMTFDLINEIAPVDKHVALGRWNGKSSLTTEYAYFFGNQHNAEWAFENKWIFDKVHQRGLSSQFYKIPMAMTYESQGIKWRCEFEFIYDLGDESLFTKQSGKRLN